MIIRRLLVGIICMSFFINLNAQTTQLKKENRWRFGVRAGANLSTIKNFNKTSNERFDYKEEEHLGLSLGLMGDYSLSDKFAFQPSLLISTKGNESEYSRQVSDTVFSVYKPDSVTSISNQDYHYSENVNMVYLEAPLLLAYKIQLNEKFRLDIQAGPYVAVGLFGKRKIKDDRFSIDQFSGDSFDKDNMFVRMDLGWAGGVVLEWNKHYRLGVNYSQGLTSLKDSVDKNDPNPKNCSWAFYVGYIF